MILALSTVFTLALLPALELTSSRTSVLAADVRLLGFQLRFPSDGAVFEYMNGTAALAAGVDPADIEAAGDDAESFIVAHGVCTVSLLLGNFEDKDRSVRSVEIEVCS